MTESTNNSKKLGKSHKTTTTGARGAPVRRGQSFFISPSAFERFCRLSDNYQHPWARWCVNFPIAPQSYNSQGGAGREGEGTIGNNQQVSNPIYTFLFEHVAESY
jgi:hypothetical protein